MVQMTQRWSRPQTHPSRSRAPLAPFGANRCGRAHRTLRLWNSATGTLIATMLEVMGNTAPTGPDVFNDGGVFTLNGVPVPPG